jgi:hypothetical protein
MRVRWHNFNVVWNTTIPTIQIWRKRRYTIFGVGGITSSTISSTYATILAPLTTYAIIVTVKAMRITSNNLEVSGGYITTTQIWGRTWYTYTRVRRMAALNRWW